MKHAELVVEREGKLAAIPVSLPSIGGVGLRTAGMLALERETDAFLGGRHEEDVYERMAKEREDPEPVVPRPSPSASAPRARASSSAPAVGDGRPRNRGEEVLPKVAEAALERAKTIDVIVVANGFAVRLDRPVGPACARSEPGLAVPTMDGKHDYPALSACIERLLTGIPSLRGGRVAISGAPDTDWQTVVATIDAVRATADGRELVPAVTFGVRRHED